MLVRSSLFYRSPRFIQSMLRVSIFFIRLLILLLGSLISLLFFGYMVYPEVAKRILLRMIICREHLIIGAI
nr:hypothetical protein [Cressdnaviricota sp.]